MKKIEELGISPTPWQIDLYVYGYVTTSIGLGVAVADGDSDYERGANAHLIVAAPELYECLREAVREKREVCIGADLYDSCTECDTCCPAKKWSAALAKAAGEEAKCEG